MTPTPIQEANYPWGFDNMGLGGSLINQMNSTKKV